MYQILFSTWRLSFTYPPKSTIFNEKTITQWDINHQLVDTPPYSTLFIVVCWWCWYCSCEGLWWEYRSKPVTCTHLLCPRECGRRFERQTLHMINCMVVRFVYTSPRFPVHQITSRPSHFYINCQLCPFLLRILLSCHPLCSYRLYLRVKSSSISFQ